MKGKLLLIGVIMMVSIAFIQPVLGICYQTVCQGDDLHRTYNSSINGEQVVIIDDPYPCKYGCTNLTEPAQCRTSIETDAFDGPFMPMPIYILLEIIAMGLFIIGAVLKSPENESYIVMPLLGMILFFILSISSISIDGVFNATMMWLNMGLGLLSLVYVFYLFFTGSKEMRQAEDALDAV